MLILVNLLTEMYHFKMTLFLIVCSWLIGCTCGRDVCNKNAILKRSEEVYLSQETRVNIELDLTDLIVTMDKILKAKGPYIKEISGYATLEKLREKEKNVLIPFNNRVNLIYVNGTAREILIKCASMKTSVYSFDSIDEIGLMMEVMKELNIESIGFVPFMTFTELLGRESQKYLWQRPASYTAQKLQDALLGLAKANGELDMIPTADTVISSFCSKPANPFDSLDFDQFEARTWVKLVDQSKSVLNVFEKLYVDLKNNMNNVRMYSYELTDTKKVAWVVPAEVLRAVEFVSGHDTSYTWETATGSTLQELSLFVKDMGVICEYISENLVFEGARVRVHPRFEREGLKDLIMNEMIMYYKDAVGEPTKLVLYGEAIGKSMLDLTKVYVYKGYAHSYSSYKPVDSIIISNQGSYRAVPTFEDLKWDCTVSKSRKICSDSHKGANGDQVICGDYFFGRSEDYKSCPLMEVTGPVVFSSICGTDVEAISSYYKDYKLSLWCNGYLTDTLELKPGVSTITTRCEIRSENGRTTYVHQTGMSVSKEGVISTVSSSSKNLLLRTIEDILGWPVSGTIIGAVTLFGIVSCYCCYKCFNCKRFCTALRFQRGIEVPENIRSGVDDRAVNRQMIRLKRLARESENEEGLLNPAGARVSIYNFSDRDSGRSSRPAMT